MEHLHFYLQRKFLSISSDGFLQGSNVFRKTLTKVCFSRSEKGQNNNESKSKGK